MVISKQRWNVTKQNFSVPHIYAPGRSEEIGVPSNLYWYISRDVLQVRALKCEKRVHPSDKRSNFKNTGANACRLFWKSRLTSTANYEKTGTIPPHSIIETQWLNMRQWTLQLWQHWSKWCFNAEQAPSHHLNQLPLIVNWTGYSEDQIKIQNNFCIQKCRCKISIMSFRLQSPFCPIYEHT